MEAKKLGLYSQILQVSNQMFYIPVYQRNYSWTELECKQLLQDISAITNKVYNTHFLGTIVYKAEDGRSNNKIVIDGQQRLTTLFLMCKALYDSVEDELISRELKDILVDRFENTNRLTLNPADNEVFKCIIENNFELIKHTESKVLQNYKYFKNYFMNQVDFNVMSFIQSLTKLEMVVIELHNDDNPQVIFESINSTGVSLTVSDLIRNYLLMGLEYDLQSRLFNSYWYKIEVILGEDNIDVFFEHYLNIKLSHFIYRKDMYVQFKKYVADSKLSTEEILEDIYTYACSYKYFINSDLVLELSDINSTKLLKKYLYDINTLDITSTRLFLTEVLVNHSKNIVSDIELIETFKLIVSYIVRRSVCNYATSSNNKVFKFLYSQINRTIDKIGYIDSLHYNLITTKNDTSSRFPDDFEFKNTLESRKLYGKYRNLDYLLMSLENADNKAIIDFSNPNIQIEHIMPQTLTKLWEEELGDEYVEVHEKYLHTLGNLTLTTYNSELSNRDFTSKKSMLNEELHFKLNTYFNGIDTWNEDSIINRSKTLANEALKLWSIPVIDEKIIDVLDDTEYNTITLEDLLIDYQSCKFTSLLIDDKVYSVSTYRDIYEEIINYCYNLNADIFNDIFFRNELFSRNRNEIHYFIYSNNADEVFSPRKIKSYDLYADVGKSGYDIIKDIKKLLDAYSVDYSTIVMTYKV